MKMFLKILTSVLKVSKSRGIQLELAHLKKHFARRTKARFLNPPNLFGALARVELEFRLKP